MSSELETSRPSEAALPGDAPAVAPRPARRSPGFWWTINGHQFPDVPMFVVQQGDVVQMTIKNHSGSVHPMHLHGHHAVVLSRNGMAATVVQQLGTVSVRWR